MTLEEALKRYGGKSSPKEEDIQKACVNWFDLTYGSLSQLLFHVANEDRQNSRKGHKYRLLGVRPGVSDLILLVPNRRYHGLCVEMKSRTGTQRKTQKEFQEKVERMGYRYALCRSLDDFIMEVTDFMEERPVSIDDFIRKVIEFMKERCISLNDFIRKVTELWRRDK